MLIIHLLCAFISIVYGAVSCIRRKMPLFYKILLYGFGCNFLGSLYLFCYELTFHLDPWNLNIGLLGYLGMHFFLISSYVGAIDRLADGGEKRYRMYRILALIPSLLLLTVFAASCFKHVISPDFFAILGPAVITVFYACKHLILPDVEMGIIRAMRPYNALLLAFTLLDTVQRILHSSGITAKTGILEILADILLVLMLPAAYKGVRKWFM